MRRRHSTKLVPHRSLPLRTSYSSVITGAEISVIALLMPLAEPVLVEGLKVGECGFGKEFPVVFGRCALLVRCRWLVSCFVFQVKVGVSAAATDPVGGFRARGVSVEGWVPRQRPRKFAVEHEEKCWWVRCTEFGGGKVGDGMGGFR